MTERSHDCTDLDQLLRLVGILGSPTEGHFWESWRQDLNGYGFKKIKACITAIGRSTRPHNAMAHDFADYVLMLFATDSPQKEAELVDKAGRCISAGDHIAVGAAFVTDLRATAWRVWRDHHDVDAATVVQQWTDAPYR
ncbi:hypothetical protein ADL27_52155 [Streptomyces sp. NRRL F-6602]|nr:hypothetical protein ADL27_52155 [Streptomyces sp. NRRL F-6602]